MHLFDRIFKLHNIGPGILHDQIKHLQSRIEKLLPQHPEAAKPRLDNIKILTVGSRLLKKDKPLFVLSIYYPLAYWKGGKDEPAYQPFDEGRQKQVVTLIRTLFLKRFESSSGAMENQTLGNHRFRNRL